MLTKMEKMKILVSCLFCVLGLQAISQNNLIESFSLNGKIQLFIDTEFMINPKDSSVIKTLSKTEYYFNENGFLLKTIDSLRNSYDSYEYNQDLSLAKIIHYKSDTISTIQIFRNESDSWNYEEINSKKIIIRKGYYRIDSLNRIVESGLYDSEDRITSKDILDYNKHSLVDKYTMVSPESNKRMVMNYIYTYKSFDDYGNLIEYIMKSNFPFLTKKQRLIKYY